MKKTQRTAHAKVDRIKRRYELFNTIKAARNPSGFLEELAQSYGPMVHVHVAGKKYIVLQHPEYIKQVLLDNHKNYRISRFSQSHGAP